MPKPRGYWKEFENVERELRPYIEKTPGGYMPTEDALRLQGRNDLIKAIQLHGGQRGVAERLGLLMRQRPSGFWNDFDKFAEEIRRFVVEYNLTSMPTANDFQQSGRIDLMNAVHRHGGQRTVSERIGIPMKRKPLVEWPNFDDLEREIRAVVAELGIDDMPTQMELLSVDRRDLLYAIHDHGGQYVVGVRLGLTPEREPPKDWGNLDFVAQELRAFLGDRTLMPTQLELQKANRRDLLYAINRHGGQYVVATQLGFTPRRKPKTDWDNFATLEREIRAFIDARGNESRSMPTQSELRRAKRNDLIYAIQHHGGMFVVAEQMGIPLDRKSLGQKTHLAGQRSRKLDQESHPREKVGKAAKKKAN